MILYRISVSLTVLLVATFVSVAGARAAAVVELFTSQGCSSCPPADRFLGELADRDDLIALTFAVDYWDYLGWRDSFGNPANSARQKSYARARGDRSVYTPQIVVNGRDHLVGSDRRSVGAALATTASHAVDVSLAVEADRIDIVLSGTERHRALKAAIWLVGFSRAEPVAIGRGENAGREVIYHNVVRKMVRVGTWDGAAQTISIGRDAVWSDAISGCAVIIQEDRHAGAGPILGAALMQESQ